MLSPCAAACPEERAPVQGSLGSFGAGGAEISSCSAVPVPPLEFVISGVSSTSLHSQCVFGKEACVFAG